ncbi:N-acetylmuramoyl-L-alanine amidase family protein [Qipengyuania marisflavi]|uniref:N-acetylmuramoyl-L-alanine amidase n=1 Tax=Qipengyuania marisflavi TaxID=2486356 RepID=A0A5S3P988_9SPHN|nr:N-acetylmuramoyl-L-alanine amidase [Qipengyuania marisflavi]TMM50011.1 N-acetylmuramoyl-L-alanine amidase [Qipengyuania marisflavi]
MTDRARILLFLLVPLALVAGVVLAVRGTAFGMGNDYVLRVQLTAVDTAPPLPEVGGDGRLPLVVIDPGHGGHDPGASGENVVEKRLVLALAQTLRDTLERENIARVALTRDDDRYLLHTERYEIARRLNADLFISIHADSAGESSEVTGASVYTLSNDASSEAARRFAERENASDRLNGIEIGTTSDAVSDILVDLSQRRTQEESALFASMIRRAGEGQIQFHPQARRSAALKVLRAPDVPSVLFESGYITNVDEAQRLSSEEGRTRFAEVMVRSIRSYFARQR